MIIVKYYNIISMEQKYHVVTKQSRSPWAWVPSLYLAEGLPYFAVNTLAVLMYARMGISNAEMAFFTGWLYLPWVIKPFWSPFVDILRTKRWWVLAMQIVLAVSMALVAFLLPMPCYFSATLAAFWLMAFASATHDIAVDGYYMLALPTHRQAAFVGIRSTFYRIAMVVGQGALVVVAGVLERTVSDIPLAWSIVFIILSVTFVLLMFYHSWAMPKVEQSGHADNAATLKSVMKEFTVSYVTFFKKPKILGALAFILLYRLPEALLIKLVQPFLVHGRDVGGLGLSVEHVGLVNGTLGVVGLLLGGIVGGICISRGGLKRWLWPMALALTLPCLFYCYLAIEQPMNLWVIGSGIFLEQAGYGFGFAAFTLYLIYFSEGEHKTSHYAFCTAFMAVGMMLPGMIAGWLQEVVGGYVNFFWIVMLSCLATFVACLLIKVDPQFGKKEKI